MNSAGNAEIVLNISLNVGDVEPQYQLGETLAQLAAKFPTVLNLAMTTGEYDGTKERTLQVRAALPFGGITTKVAELCEVLRQDSIAILWSGAREWVLIGGAGDATPGGSVEAFPPIV